MLPALQTATISHDDPFPEPHPDFETFVENYLPVVHNVVGRFRHRLPAHVDMGDLFSVGVTGLISAVSNYTEDRAKTFGGYAVQRIRGAILDELRNSDTRSRRARLKARMIAEAASEIEQRTGRPATDEQVQRHLGLSNRVFAKWQTAARQATFVSLDASRDDEDSGGARLHDALRDESADMAFEDVERSERHARLAECIKALPERQRKVIALYYHEGLRFAEIAEAFGVSESRICQIHGHAVRTLREQMTAERAE